MLDSLDADMAKGMLAAVRGSSHGAKVRPPSLFDMIGVRLSLRRGGVEEKSELRRSGDGVEWKRVEEKQELRI